MLIMFACLLQNLELSHNQCLLLNKYKYPLIGVFCIAALSEYQLFLDYKVNLLQVTLLSTSGLTNNINKNKLRISQSVVTM